MRNGADQGQDYQSGLVSRGFCVQLGMSDMDVAERLYSKIIGEVLYIQLIILVMEDTVPRLLISLSNIPFIIIPIVNVMIHKKILTAMEHLIAMICALIILIKYCPGLVAAITRT
jgi:hypothetical protein